MRDKLSSLKHFSRMLTTQRCKNYKINIAMLGSGAVGKTAILQRWTKNEFSESYHPTVSEIFEQRTKRSKDSLNDSELDLRIIDTCGSIAFPAMDRLTILHSDAFIIVYSIDSEKSFLYAQRLAQKVAEIKQCERIPLIVIGSKVDLTENRKVTFDRGLQLAVEAKAPFMEVSAKSGLNIDDIFYVLCKRFDTLTSLSNLTKRCGR